MNCKPESLYYKYHGESDKFFTNGVIYEMNDYDKEFGYLLDNEDIRIGEPLGQHAVHGKFFEDNFELIN